MTKRELVVWIEYHGCFIEQLPEGRAKVVKYYNPNTGTAAYVSTPIDDKPLNNYTVYKICALLGISPPDCAAHLKTLHDEIENHDKNKRGKAE